MNAAEQDREAHEALDAVRLALEAGVDDHARVVVVRAILERAPAIDPGGTKSVERFLEGVRESMAELKLAS